MRSAQWVGILNIAAPYVILTHVFYRWNMDEIFIELVSKELNYLVAILHVYAGGLNFMK